MRISLSLYLRSLLPRARGWWKFICSRYDRPPSILKLDTNNPCTERLCARPWNMYIGLAGPLLSTYAICIRAQVSSLPPCCLTFDKGNDGCRSFYRHTRKFATISHARDDSDLSTRSRPSRDFSRARNEFPSLIENVRQKFILLHVLLSFPFSLLPAHLQHRARWKDT